MTSITSELAPSGALRAAINFGNTVLARREADGSPGGITADIAREVARRLGVTVQFVLYERADAHRNRIEGASLAP
jgi:polar amino acid transport system substrate-binding protein